jgi:hypothetical protein
MKLQALALVAGLAMTGSAYAIDMNPVDTADLGSFGPGQTYGGAFYVAAPPNSTIDNSLTFNINTALYAGAGVSDIPLTFSVAITDITDLSAEIYDSSSTLLYTFVPNNGDNDHLILPANSYFATGDYTLKVGGTTAGASGGFYSVAAITVPVPEPETWGMLLVGLGLVGLRLRQKNTVSRQAALN